MSKLEGSATPLLLRGLRVILLAVNLPGPVAAARLRDMGAAITKIEPPDGDPLAAVCPNWYRALVDGVTVLTLNLKDEEGRRALQERLQSADLLLTSLRPAALARLELDWPALAAAYPRLCQVAITGYPPPHENVAGHDLTYQAQLGLLRPPHNPPTLLADMAGAEMAVSAALALLLARERGLLAGRDEARFRLVALSEAAAHFARPRREGLTTPDGLLGGRMLNYRLFETADGWIALAALEPHFWLRLLTVLGLAKEEEERLPAVFREQKSETWQRWARSHDIPLDIVSGPV